MDSLNFEATSTTHCRTLAVASSEGELNIFLLIRFRPSCLQGLAIGCSRQGLVSSFPAFGIVPG